MAPRIVLRVNFDPENRLVRDEDLDRVVVVRRCSLQRHPRIGDPADAVHVVRHAIDRRQLDHRHLAIHLAAKRRNRLREDVFEEVPVEGDTVGSRCHRGGHGRNPGREVDDAGGLSHPGSVPAAQPPGKAAVARPTMRTRRRGASRAQVGQWYTTLTP